MSQFILFLMFLIPIISGNIHENEIETGCTPPGSDSASDIVDINFLMTANKLYFPLASKGSLHFWKDQFGLRNQSVGHEAEKPCLVTEINLFTAKTSGYGGKSYMQDCYLSGLGKIQCVPNDASKSDEEKLKSPASSTASFVLTDNKSYLLSTRCIGEKIKDWTLLSLEKKIGSDIKKLVLEKVRELGFKPENHIEMSYEEC